MFASLQSRLWLTYLILIIILLSLVAGGVLVSLANNPIIYRESVQQIRQGLSDVIDKLDKKNRADIPELSAILEDVSQSSGIRFLILDHSSQVIIDTNANDKSSLKILRITNSKIRNIYDETRVRLIRDNSNRVWLFATLKITDNFWLLAAVPAPKLGVMGILKDEFISPIFWAGVLGIFIAFFLSYLLSSWISKPIKAIADASKSLSKGNFKRIPLEGPREIKEVAGTFNEMTSRIQEIQNSQKKFIADVSHELKTPLTSIQGFSRAMLDGTITNPEEVHGAADVIFSESDRMARMVADLLTLAKIDSGAEVLNISIVDLNQLLKEVVIKFQFQAEISSVNVENDLPIFQEIRGDRDKLIQVFSNLLDNAIKYSSSPGKVKLTGYSGVNEVVIQVKDTGVGLSDSDQKHIFDRFFQADKSRKGGTGKGVGLGLSISKEVITAHGGIITVQSSPGKGSTFTVKLPV